MRTPKLLSLAVGGLGWIAVVAAASADEVTDSLASMHRALAGNWSGRLSGTDASGAKFEDDDSFTFVVTSDDGLDSATWSAGTLELAAYEGDGRYRIRNWNQAGRQRETQLQVQITDEPDVSGNGAWVFELQQRASDGTVMDAREHFTLNDDTLDLMIEMRPVGSNEPFKSTVSGTWSRESEQ